MSKVAFFAALVAIALSGCSPNRWGGYYHVLSATPDRVTLEYNPVLITPGGLEPVLIEYCARTGRLAYLQAPTRTEEGAELVVECRV